MDYAYGNCVNSDQSLTVETPFSSDQILALLSDPDGSEGEDDGLDVGPDGTDEVVPISGKIPSQAYGDPSRSSPEPGVGREQPAPLVVPASIPELGPIATESRRVDGVEAVHRIVPIAGHDYVLRFGGGYFHSNLRRLNNAAPDYPGSWIKVHVATTGAQDLARLHAVLMPAIRNHPELRQLIKEYKAIDPAFCQGGGMGVAPTDNINRARAYTLYCVNPADAVRVQQILSEILRAHDLGLAVPPAGVSDRFDRATNRVGIVRDTWERSRDADMNRAYRLDRELQRRIESQYGSADNQGRLSPNELRRVEREVGLRLNTLSYDAYNRLVFTGDKSTQPYNGGLYAAKVSDPAAHNARAHRPPLYRLYAHFELHPVDVLLETRNERAAMAVGGRATIVGLDVAPERGVVVGRATSPDMHTLNTSDSHVNRRHARFSRDGAGRLFVCDLDSTHGTWVIREGQAPRRITGTPFELQPHDVVWLGHGPPANIDTKGLEHFNGYALRVEASTAPAAPGGDGNAHRPSGSAVLTRSSEVLPLERKNGPSVSTERSAGGPAVSADRPRLRAPGSPADERPAVTLRAEHAAAHLPTSRYALIGWLSAAIREAERDPNGRERERLYRNVLQELDARDPERVRAAIERLHVAERLYALEQQARALSQQRECRAYAELRCLVSDGLIPPSVARDGLHQGEFSQSTQEYLQRQYMQEARRLRQAGDARSAEYLEAIAAGVSSRNPSERRAANRFLTDLCGNRARIISTGAGLLALAAAGAGMAMYWRYQSTQQRSADPVPLTGTGPTQDG